MSAKWKIALVLLAVAAPLCGQRPCVGALRGTTATVRVPGHPFEPIFSKDGCTVFVSLAPEGAIAVLEWHKNGYRLRRTVPIGGRPTGMVLTHDGETLIAADFGQGQVDVLDVARLVSGHGNPVRARLGGGTLRGAVYVNVTPDDRDVLVSDERAASVSVVELSGGHVVGAIPAGLAPIALTYSRDGRWLFMTSEVANPDWGWARTCPSQASAGRGGPQAARKVMAQGAILVARASAVETDPARAVVATVAAGCSPVRLVLSPDGGTAYVTARTDDAVVAYSTAKLEANAADAELGRVGVGTAPVGVAATPDGRWVIATDSNRFGGGGGQLDLIPAAAFGAARALPRRTLAAGQFPRELRFRPDGAVLAVTNFGSEAVEFINLARALPRS